MTPNDDTLRKKAEYTRLNDALIAKINDLMTRAAAGDMWPNEIRLRVDSEGRVDPIMELRPRYNKQH